MRAGAAEAGGQEERILILAPSRRDAPTVAQIIGQAGLGSHICADLATLCCAFEQDGAGAALIAEEALAGQQNLLRDCLERQPPWSDLPIVVVAAPAMRQSHRPLGDWANRCVELGNVTLLERPLRSATLISTLRSALRTRRRQYQAREHLRERELSEERLRAREAELRRLNESLEQRVLERTRALEEANHQLRSEAEERRRIEQALHKAQKMEAIGQLTGGIAHDFNNLLSAMLGNLELLEARLGDDPIARRLARSATRAGERGAKLTQQLLAFARKQHLRPEPVDINAAVAGMGDLLRRTIGGTIRLKTELQPELWPALADPNQIELVILNLAINARDAMPSGGVLTIGTANLPAAAALRPEDLPPGDFVQITVTDNGVGMGDDVLARAFEPFFTTKEIGKGTGLGLAQVYGVVKQSGGDVRLHSRLGAGTRVEIYLPRTQRAPSHAAAETAGARTQATRATILVVDDDPDVREVVVAGLEALGYDVRTASGPGAALEFLNGAGDERCADLLLVDYAMPEMTGAQLARSARTRWPDLPLVFITGYADAQALDGEFRGAAAVVRKPFKLAELGRAIEAALQRKPIESIAASEIVPPPNAKRFS